jgi:hypothetical protein
MGTTPCDLIEVDSLVLKDVRFMTETSCRLDMASISADHPAFHPCEKIVTGVALHITSAFQCHVNMHRTTFGAVLCPWY